MKQLEISPYALLRNLLVPLVIFVLGVVLYEAISHSAAHPQFASMLSGFASPTRNNLLQLQEGAIRTLSAIVMFLVSCSFGVTVAVRLLMRWCKNRRLPIGIGVILVALNSLALVHLSGGTNFRTDYFSLTELALTSSSFFQYSLGGLSFSSVLFLLCIVFGQAQIWFALIAVDVLSQEAAKSLETNDDDGYLMLIQKLRVLLISGAISLAFCVVAFDAWLMWPVALIEEIPEKKALLGLISAQRLYIALIFSLILLSSYISITSHFSRIRDREIEPAMRDNERGDDGQRPFLTSHRAVFGDILAILAPILSTQLGNIAQLISDV